MDAAKIRLSAKEMGVVRSTDLILTKNAILQKTKELWGELKLKYDKVLQVVSLKLDPSSAKISRGENYKGLPWVILDHPRFFSNTDILAMRTMFWWGNFFSITLHLAGEPKKAAEQKIIDSYKKLKKSGYRICVNKEQWQHDMGKKNYRSLEKLSKEEFATIVHSKSFLKLVNTVSLKKWDRAQQPLLGFFEELIELATV
jgi:hypothetical protein